ncbi:MAG TPA: branched-chain amino acid ABC transporter permease [Syntrophales bacterium]|nr:branched-chain amino acid ABC transporter permease [Syntrophales bacterium]
MKKEMLKFFIFATIIIIAPVFIKGGYLMNVLIFVGIYTILAVALNLLLGLAGQISLGQAAFFGLGAYLSGVLTATYTVNPWLSMVIAFVTVGVIAFIIGFPILKLRGHYLAMATLGMGIIVYIVFNETVDLTGGPSGLSGIPRLSIGGMIFDSDLKSYYLVWFFTIVVILLSINLASSRIGRALRAIHDSEVAARIMGVNARLLKVEIFTCSGMFSALAGSLYAHIVTFISPTSFGFNVSIELLTMVIVGGLGSIYGSFLGAAILTLLPEFFRAFQDYDIIVYGITLIVITMFMPGGLVRGVPFMVLSMYNKLRPASGSSGEGG